MRSTSTSRSQTSVNHLASRMTIPILLVIYQCIVVDERGRHAEGVVISSNEQADGHGPSENIPQWNVSSEEWKWGNIMNHLMIELDSGANKQINGCSPLCKSWRRTEGAKRTTWHCDTWPSVNVEKGCLLWFLSDVQIIEPCQLELNQISFGTVALLIRTAQFWVAEGHQKDGSKTVCS